MQPEVIYICSDNRSGSTLLDQLLGSHPDITSLGEVVHLNAYVLEDRAQYNPRHSLICSCGERVAECGFWTQAAQEAGRPLAEFKLGRRRAGAGSSRATRWAHARLNRLLARQLAPLNRFRPVRRFTGGLRMAEDSFALFDGIGRATNTRFVVDSSKDPLRCLSLYHHQPHRIKVILLARDYRGVVHSKMKRNVSMENAVRGWVTRVRQMEALSRELPASSVFRLRYEDLCANSQVVLKQICEFVGTEFCDAMLNRDGTGTHHIGGSPSKFDLSKGRISIDESYRSVFDSTELTSLRNTVENHAQVWGYD